MIHEVGGEQKPWHHGNSLACGKNVGKALVYSVEVFFCFIKL